MKMKLLVDLMKDVGAWCEYNFDYHAPHIGMAEEVGELTHAVLKRDQKIRKYANDPFYQQAVKDALSDIGIYMLHHCYLNGLMPAIINPRPTGENLNQLLGAAHSFAGQIISLTEVGMGQSTQVLTSILLQIIDQIAAMHSFNLVFIINDTWTNEVSLRNWRKFPNNGLTK